MALERQSVPRWRGPSARTREWRRRSILPRGGARTTRTRAAGPGSWQARKSAGRSTPPLRQSTRLQREGATRTPPARAIDLSRWLGSRSFGVIRKRVDQAARQAADDAKPQEEYRERSRLSDARTGRAQQCNKRDLRRAQSVDGDRYLHDEQDNGNDRDVCQQRQFDPQRFTQAPRLHH